jgi:hypothetical protein
VQGTFGVWKRKGERGGLLYQLIDGVREGEKIFFNREVEDVSVFDIDRHWHVRLAGRSPSQNRSKDTYLP